MAIMCRSIFLPTGGLHRALSRCLRTGGAGYAGRAADLDSGSRV